MRRTEKHSNDSWPTKKKNRKRTVPIKIKVTSTFLVRIEVLATVTIKTMWNVMQIGNNVSEEPAASTFRVEGTAADSFKTLVITLYSITSQKTVMFT
jgi:hypothetical protein